MVKLRQSNFFHLLIPSIAICFIVVVQAVQFQDRAYRQDEAWVVHYAIENIERVGLLNHILQVFRLLPPENVIQDVWVYLFGHVEPIVRFFSTLTTAVTLALFYRLASDLFDKQTGRIAIFLLGTLSIFAFFTHEARPYAALAFGTIGFQLALLRFIRHPNRTYALMTLFFGVIPFYQHPFLLYVYATQLICIVIFVRWNRELYMRGVALFAVLGVLVGLRIYINFAERGGEILYATATTLDAIVPLYNEFKFNPESLGLFLFLAGFAIPITRLWQNKPDATFRFGIRWRKWWAIVALIAMLLLVMFVNALSPNVTPRNLLIIAPYIALIAAYALRYVPLQGQMIAVAMFCVPFMVQFRFHISNAGYHELRDFMAEQYTPAIDRIIMIAPQSWEWIPIKYYLDERTDLALSNRDILYISTQKGGRFTPQPPDPEVVVRGFTDEDFQRIRDYLGEQDRVWVIKGNPFPLGDRILNWLDNRYSPYTSNKFEGDGYYRALEVVEYRRQPDQAETVVRFGEDIHLKSWRLNNSIEVQACQSISVDTWWQTDVRSPKLYSSTLVITSANGQGLVNVDDMPGGMFLTSQWQPDQLYFDERQLTVPCDIQAGEYLLLLGLYDLETIDNLPVNTPDGEPLGTNLFYLTTLFVK